MAESPIEWTDFTWVPFVGCSKVSEGCKNCYAMMMAARVANAAQARLREGKLPLTEIQTAYRKVVRWERGGMFAADANDKALPQWNNRIELIESILLAPLSWKKPRKVFVNSMSDLFHKDIPFEFIDKVFAVMALTPQHTYQVLTKRPERMAEYLNEMERPGPPGGLFGKTTRMLWSLLREMRKLAPNTEPCLQLPLSNVWLGTSVENQEAADERIPHLLKCPAAVRFLSCEPLIGAVDLTRGPALCIDAARERTGGFCHDPFSDLTTGIHWVIAGGESGHKARPMHPDWVRSLRDQCEAAGVPFFWKQWGEWHPRLKNGIWPDGRGNGFETCEHVLSRWVAKGGLHLDGTTEHGAALMKRVGKKAAGRLLDGREHNGFPEVANA